MKILRLKKGDLLVKSLEEKVGNIASGVIVGIGALNWARLKIYNLNKKKYTEEKFNGPLELISFTATIAKSTEGKTGLHAHCVLSGEDFKAIGGHMEEAEVAATFEAVIIDSTKKVERYFDKDIGLNLIKD